MMKLTKIKAIKTLKWWHLISGTLISTKLRQWCNRCKNNKNCSNNIKKTIKLIVTITLISLQSNLRWRTNNKKWISKLNNLVMIIIHLIRLTSSMILVNQLSAQWIHSNLLPCKVMMIILQRKLFLCKGLNTRNKKESEIFLTKENRSNKPKETNRIKPINLFNNFRPLGFNKLNRRKEKIPWLLSKLKRNN